MSNPKSDLTSVLTEANKDEFIGICKELINFFKKSIEGGWTKIKIPNESKPGKHYNSSTFEDKLKKFSDGIKPEESKQYLTDGILALCKHNNIIYNSNAHFEKVTGITTILHYIIYYWYEYKVGNSLKHRINMGYLELTAIKSGENNFTYSSSIDLYYQQTSLPAKSPVSDKFWTGINSDSVDRMGESLVMRMRDSRIPKILSQWIFFVGNQEIEDWNFLLGTYSTVGRTSTENKPSAGIALIERKENKNECVSLIRTHQVDDAIYHYLFSTRLHVPNDVFDGIHALPNDVNTEVRHLAHYIGTYETYIVSNTHDEIYLMKFITRFHGNSEAEVLLEDPETRKMNLYTGRIRIGHNESIICYLDLIKERKLHRFSFYISHKRHRIENSNFTLYGVYGGIEVNDRIPIAGPIRFKRIDDIIAGENWTDKYKDSIKSYSQDSDEFLDVIGTDEDLWLLFMGGHEANYIGALYSIEGNHNEELTEENESLKKEVERLRNELVVLNSTSSRDQTS